MPPIPLDLGNPAAFVGAVVRAVLQDALRDRGSKLPAGIAGGKVEAAKGVVDDLAKIGIKRRENLRSRGGNGGPDMSGGEPGGRDAREIEVWGDGVLKSGDRGARGQRARDAEKRVVHGDVRHGERTRTARRSPLVLRVHFAGVVTSVEFERNRVPEHDVVVHGLLLCRIAFP
jgi:hypothetical protein